MCYCALCTVCINTNQHKPHSLSHHLEKPKVCLCVSLTIYANVETNNRLNLVLRQRNKKELIKIKAF